MYELGHSTPANHDPERDWELGNFGARKRSETTDFCCISSMLGMRLQALLVMFKDIREKGKWRVGS